VVWEDGGGNPASYPISVSLLSAGLLQVFCRIFSLGLSSACSYRSVKQFAKYSFCSGPSTGDGNAEFRRNPLAFVHAFTFCRRCVCHIAPARTAKSLPC
ncbi:hypothetical protein OQE62_14510, partial [Microbulbifer halophilus]